MASSLYIGQVMHQRLDPVMYQFHYKTLSLKIDIDSFEQETRALRWLSFDRFNLFSVKLKDHGARDGRPWREWIDDFLAQYGIARPAKVELLCYPRILGYSFNPLAMWYAYDADSRLMAVVAEVSNTFGQWHHYVLPIAAQSTQTTLKSSAEKVFHVSPFIGMDAEYHFRLRPPREQVYTHISETRRGNLFFYASQTGRAKALTDTHLLRYVGFAPMQAFKVIGLIHWWALKIWLKGARFHRTPAALSDVQYSHSEMKSC
ncbi:MAG: DUF1365 domain-containing protein [Thiomicrospira sp.]|jgi:DUF1365 family protein|nr:DUF1365 domain-containing protein [Thiomicrospira sp.]